MPGPVISEYLEKHTYKGFDEVASVFRHDFVLYAGMLSSWTALIDAEVMMASEAAFATEQSAEQFRQASSQLQSKTEAVFAKTSAHLYPKAEPAPDKEPFAQVKQTWDDFFAEFRTFALDELNALETEVRAFTKLQDFEAVIEEKLSPLAEGDAIAMLLLRPFERLRDLLNPERFDARMAETMSVKKPD